MVFQCSRRAFYVPALFVGATAFINLFFLADWVRLAGFLDSQAGVGTGSVLRVLLGVGALWSAAASWRLLSVKGEALWVRGLHTRRCLERGACVFGVSPDHRGRGGQVYVVFVTDSVVSEAIGVWSRESAARATAARLQALVGPPAMTPRRELATRQVAQIDQEWEKRKQMWAAYRQSKAGRSVNLTLAGLVLLGFLAIGLYMHLCHGSVPPRAR